MTEPKENDKQPAAPASPPEAPRFEPPAGASARVMRVRAAVLIATVGLLVGAFVLVLGYRPPLPQGVAGTHGARERPETIAGELPVGGSAATPAPRAQAGPADVTRAAVSAMDDCIARARDLWVRAADQMPQELTVRERTGDAAGMLRRAGILADSATALLSSAESQTVMIQAAARRASGLLSYHISSVYAAAGEYLRVLQSDASDRRAYYQAWEDAMHALASGDTSEAEIKKDVAGSYQRRSETRKRTLDRLSNQLREALGGLDTPPR